MRAASLFRVLIFGFVFIRTAEVAFAQPFVVTIEAPGVQQSSLFTNPTAFGASNVVVEPFDELKAGFISKAFPFAGNAALGNSKIPLLLHREPAPSTIATPSQVGLWSAKTRNA